MTKRGKKISKEGRSHRSSPYPVENISVGDISGGTGIAIGSRAQAIVKQNTDVSADQIALAFKALEQSVNAMPEGPDKTVAQNAVTGLEKEAHKGSAADESKIQKWMNFLLDTAPDAWEVAVDVFTNPAKGIGTIFKKVAEKAKIEQEKR